MWLVGSTQLRVSRPNIDSESVGGAWVASYAGVKVQGGADCQTESRISLERSDIQDFCVGWLQVLSDGASNPGLRIGGARV